MVKPWSHDTAYPPEPHGVKEQFPQGRRMPFHGKGVDAEQDGGEEAEREMSVTPEGIKGKTIVFQKKR